VIAMVLATVVGWGLVVNTTLKWQGYLLEPFALGPKINGPWSFANLGVLAALVLGFLVQWLFARRRVRAQELEG
jgi:NCS1 family nucleobase:cation symporter-1